ncbi:MAG TPA: nucleoside-diphosphate kinase [Candidatus Methylomirabilis sp.]|nr:nucleoside-diphosphate kinase [Candidatus Methylomirabilis sp.]
MTERTLVMVKPDAVRRGHVGEVIRRLEAEGLTIRAMKMVLLERREAEGFYQVHKERPFFESLTRFMSSGPAVAMVLEGAGAIAKVRTLMGATDPAKADPGTIRKDLATNVEQNAVHGSDSPESAAYEIPFFFSSLEQHAYDRVGR